MHKTFTSFTLFCKLFYHCTFSFICPCALLTVFAKLSEPKLSQLSSEDEDVSMGISFVFRNAVRFLRPEQRRCKKTTEALNKRELL